MGCGWGWGCLPEACGDGCGAEARTFTNGSARLDAAEYGDAAAGRVVRVTLRPGASQAPAWGRERDC